MSRKLNSIPAEENKGPQESDKLLWRYHFYKLRFNLHHGYFFHHHLSLVLGHVYQNLEIISSCIK
ncbi:hypothetical protein JOB18_014309 [Solea senegalensis]|uniref:Uncharacterized protein n=1 Tax=Solea senegalensis TaxID=28829 RepID=A0AAV6RAQ1_SOLSE|nr:hypothetical protein JOB18_014309 [Solea senegalensis]